MYQNPQLKVDSFGFMELIEPIPTEPLQIVCTILCGMVDKEVRLNESLVFLLCMYFPTTLGILKVSQMVPNM